MLSEWQPVEMSSPVEQQTLAPARGLVVLDSEHIVVAYKFNIGLPVIWDAFPLRNLLTR